MRNWSMAFVLLFLFGMPILAADTPNILFIAIDDQNDWIGCLNGHPHIKTPNIDRLASRGTVFTNAHCQSPLCNSSRTSLMTGLRPSTTGIYGLAPWFRDVEQYKDLVSLPQYLKKRGYTTYSTGKIYHGGYGRKNTDNEFDVLGPAAGVGVWPKQKLVDTPAKHKLVDWGVFPHRDEDKGDWKVASWAVDQLNRKPKEPFFLSVGFFLPHVPCYATQKWFDLYPEDSLELPPLKRERPRRHATVFLVSALEVARAAFQVPEEANEWKNLVRSYLACTSFVDSQVGRVLDALESNGLEENTVVVLWSDHGWHLGEKLITGKNTLWDRSTRVPLIFRRTRHCQVGEMFAASRTARHVSDSCRAVRLPEQPGLEGHSLLAQLDNSDAPRRWPAITTHNHDNHGVRSEHWRYIRYADGSEELYDMRKDPNEWNNLLSDPRNGRDPAISKDRSRTSPVLTQSERQTGSWQPKSHPNSWERQNHMGRPGNRSEGSYSGDLMTTARVKKGNNEH